MRNYYETVREPDSNSKFLVGVTVSEVKSIRDKAYDIIHTYIEDEGVAQDCLNDLSKYLLGSMTSTQNRQVTEREMLVRELYDAGIECGEASRQTGLSFQTTRYYYLKFGSQDTGIRVNGLKELSDLKK